MKITSISVVFCLATTVNMAAAQNQIAPTKKSGELMDIAMKAMATDPSDRYATAHDFQDAIRNADHTITIADE